MNDLPFPARVNAARSLLEDVPDDEYATLTAEQRANVEEAIEFLHRVGGTFRGEFMYE